MYRAFLTQQSALLPKQRLFRLIKFVNFFNYYTIYVSRLNYNFGLWWAGKLEGNWP